jgi:hypothetical protein
MELLNMILINFETIYNTDFFAASTSKIFKI